MINSLLNLFFFKYNQALKTKILEFKVPYKCLFIVKLFYKKGFLAFYIIHQNIIVVYLPKNVFKIFSKWQSFNFKHKKIYHQNSLILHNGLYWTNAGLFFGVDCKKLNLGGRLLYKW